MLCMAFKTPFPLYLFSSPSLSSSASCEPVDFPEGTVNLPYTPDSKITSTCTVGFPLESNTSLASIISIKLMLPPNYNSYKSVLLSSKRSFISFICLSFASFSSISVFKNTSLSPSAERISSPPGATIWLFPVK